MWIFPYQTTLYSTSSLLHPVWLVLWIEDLAIPVLDAKWVYSHLETRPVFMLGDDLPLYRLENRDT